MVNLAVVIAKYFMYKMTKLMPWWSKEIFFGIKKCKDGIMIKTAILLMIGMLSLNMLFTNIGFAAPEKEKSSMSEKMPVGSKKIYFAGGCFWGVEEYFDRMRGVVDVTSGYANGNTKNPSYEDVTRKRTGHAETVEVTYNPKEVSLESLVERFFKIVDPLSVNKQGNDVGKQYRTGIYYTDNEEKVIIAKVMAKEQKKYSKPIVVENIPLVKYYLAEEYHQDYLKKNPNGYCHIDLNAYKDEKSADKENAKNPSKLEVKQRLEIK